MYSRFCAPGAAFRVRRLKTGNGADLNCITFTPPVQTERLPVVFVPGFASVIENFTSLLVSLTGKFTVHYVETRDKSTSIMPAGSTYSVRDIASDISGAIEEIGLEDGKFIFTGFSLASTASAEWLSSATALKPSLAVLAAPNAEFRIPPIGIFIARYFTWSFRFIRPLLKLYIRKFHVNTEKDYEMYLITSRALDQADPVKLSATLLEMVKYKIHSALPYIDVPVIVIGASHDIFHNLNDAHTIAGGIKGAIYYDLETNSRTHSGEVSDIILSYA